MARVRLVRTVRPMNPTRTHYELLGLAPDADTAAIKSMYRKLVRTMHPDAGGNGALFGLITEAYECLRDPEKRAEYDRSLTAGEDSAPDPRAEEAGPNPYTDLFASYEAFRRATAEAEAAPLFTPWEPENAAQSDRQNAADAQAKLAAESLADRRLRHPLRLWLPLGAAVLVGAAASFAMGHFGATRWVDQWAVFALGLMLRAGLMVLFGGFLISRRNAMSRLSAFGASAITLVWALITAFADHLPPAFELLAPAVFVVVMVTGVRARGGEPAGLFRTLLDASKESLLCAWEAVRVGLSSAFWGLLAVFGMFSG